MQRLLLRVRSARVLRNTLLYSGSVWGFLQVVDFISEKFQWNPDVIRVLTIVGFASIPSAAIFFYYRGVEGSAKKQLVFYTFNVILIVGLCFFVDPFSQTDPTKKMVSKQDKSVAVLPFENLSSDLEQSYFSEGVTEEITIYLSKIKGLRVSSRSSVKSVGNLKTADIRTIGRELNVSFALEGSVRKAGNKLRITAQLVDVSNDQRVWTEVYDRELNDVFAVQSEIAKAIAGKFKLIVSRQVDELISTPPTKNVEAYDLYLKASNQPMQLGDASNLDADRRAMSYLRKAIALDPNYTDAYTLMSWYYQSENVDSAIFFAKEAIVRNPNSAKGYLALGNTLEFEEAVGWALKACPLDSVKCLEGLGDVYYQTGDLATAILYYQEALQLNPNMVDFYASIAFYYQHLGEPDSVNKYINIATRISPHDDYANFVASEQAQYSTSKSNFETPIRHYYASDTIRMNKGLGLAYLMRRDWAKARTHYSWSDYRDMDWGFVLMKTGSIDSGKQVLKKSFKENKWMGAKTLTAASLGDEKAAVTSFKKLFNTSWHDITYLRLNPMFDNMRSNSEFAAVMGQFEKRNSDMLERIRSKTKAILSSTNSN